MILCFLEDSPQSTPLISEYDTLAIEVMYTDKQSPLVIEPDGWTIASKNAKIAGLFEETIAVTSSGAIILTQ